jgi:thiol-disulfide isomerase/thioredoxin
MRIEFFISFDHPPNFIAKTRNPSKMKKCFPLILLVLCMGCQEKNSLIREKSKKLLSTEKAINYNFSELTIQGSTEEDTTFIEQFDFASFLKDPKDTIVGYHYFIQDSLIHPYFQVPLKTVYHYDGNVFHTGTICSLTTKLKDESFSELNKEVYSNVMKGQLPSIIRMLGDPNAKIAQDTIVSNERCMQLLSVIGSNPQYLFISRKTYLPVMMRIVTNRFQPYIEEYYYKDFQFSTELKIADYKTEIRNYSPPKLQSVLMVGDTLPGWEITDLSGKTVTINGSKKIKIIYLSMINCGPCQYAIPYVEEIYNTYKNSDRVNFYTFYPYDSHDKLIKYIKTKRITSPIFRNSYEDEKKRIEVISNLKMGYPSVLIVDGNNEIQHIIHGFSTGIGSTIQKQVQKVLDKE